MAGCCLKPLIRLQNLSSNAASNKNNMNTGCRVGADAAYREFVAAACEIVAVMRPISNGGQVRRSLMKFAFGAALLLSLIGPARAEPGIVIKSKLRFADAADACFANCTNQNASCKRVCPTTFSTPCLSACDSQAQTCRQSCQNR